MVFKMTFSFIFLLVDPVSGMLSLTKMDKESMHVMTKRKGVSIWTDGNGCNSSLTVTYLVIFQCYYMSGSL